MEVTENVVKYRHLLPITTASACLTTAISRTGTITTTLNTIIQIVLIIILL